MTTAQPTTLLGFWLAALETPCGIAISTDDPMLLKGKLYAARKSESDPRLHQLRIRSSPVAPKTEIWIVHGDQEPSVNITLADLELE